MPFYSSCLASRLCLFVQPVFALQPTFTNDLQTRTTITLLRSPTMSASNQTPGPSTVNYNAIFEAAITEYKTITGHDLRKHAFSAALETLNSPDAILKVFQTQTQDFDKVRKKNKRMIELLTPIVEIVFIFSSALGEGVGVVSIHFFLYHSTITSMFS